MNFVAGFFSLWLCFSNVLGVPYLERFHELERGANSLPIDGGGTRGVIPVVALAQMEIDAAKQIRSTLTLGTLQETAEFQDPELAGQLRDLFRIHEEIRTFLEGLIERRSVKNLEGEEELIEIVPIHRMFGTIFGTSIGAIIAGALSCPDSDSDVTSMPAYMRKAKFCAHDLLNFFLEESYDIFPNFECSCTACCTSGCCGRTWVGPCLNTGRNMRHNCARDWTCNNRQFGDDSCLCIPGLPGFCSNACCFACCCGGGGCCQNWCGFAGPRYSAVPLKRILREKFGSTKMADALTHLGVTVTNPRTREVKYFIDKDKKGVGEKSLIKDVAAASGSAPTFLPGAQIPGYEDMFVDGGVTNNNPSLEAALEAVRYFRSLLKKYAPADGQGTDVDGHSTHEEQPVVSLPPDVSAAPQVISSITDIIRGAEEQSHIEAQANLARLSDVVVEDQAPPSLGVQLQPEALSVGVHVDEPPVSSHRGTPRHSLDYRGERSQERAASTHEAAVGPQTASQDDLETEVAGGGSEGSASYNPSLLKRIRVFSLGTGEIAPKSQNHLRRKGKLSWIEPTIEIGMMGLDKANFEKVKKLTTCSRLQPILLDELEDFTRPSNVSALILLTEGYLRGKGREEYQSMLSNLPGGNKYMSRLIEEIRRQVSLI